MSRLGIGLSPTASKTASDIGSSSRPDYCFFPVFIKYSPSVIGQAVSVGGLSSAPAGGRAYYARGRLLKCANSQWYSHQYQRKPSANEGQASPGGREQQCVSQAGGLGQAPQEKTGEARSKSTCWAPVNTCNNALAHERARTRTLTPSPSHPPAHRYRTRSMQNGAKY